MENNKIKASYLIMFSEKMFGDEHQTIKTCLELVDGRYFIIYDQGKGTRYKQITFEEFVKFSELLNQ